MTLPARPSPRGKSFLYCRTDFNPLGDAGEAFGGGFINAKAADSSGPAGLGIDLDDRAVEANVVVGHFVLGGAEGAGRLHDPFDPPAEDAFVRAGHADVALEGGSAGQDLLVGRWDVRMGAEDGAGAAVEIPAQKLLVAGGLGVVIALYDADVAGQRG